MAQATAFCPTCAESVREWYPKRPPSCEECGKNAATLCAPRDPADDPKDAVHRWLCTDCLRYYR